METITKSTKLTRTIEKANNIVSAVLGFEYGAAKDMEAWFRFRDALLTDDSIDKYRINKDFKWGMQLLTYVIDYLKRIDSTEDRIVVDRLYRGLSDTLIEECHAGYESDYKAVLVLIDCLKIISANSKVFEADDINDLQIDLNTIANCQRMVLDVVKSENEKQAA
jgi:hypothetical protein